MPVQDQQGRRPEGRGQAGLRGTQSSGGLVSLRRHRHRAQWGRTWGCRLHSCLERLRGTAPGSGAEREAHEARPTRGGPWLLRTSQPPAQLLGEEDQGQLALAVGGLGVILPPLPVQVLEVHVPGDVGQGREVDHAPRHRGFQLVQQQIRQEEVT